MWFMYSLAVMGQLYEATSISNPSFIVRDLCLKQNVFTTLYCIDIENYFKIMLSVRNIPLNSLRNWTLLLNVHCFKLENHNKQTAACQ